MRFLGFFGGVVARPEKLWLNRKGRLLDAQRKRAADLAALVDPSTPVDTFILLVNAELRRIEKASARARNRRTAKLAVS